MLAEALRLFCPLLPPVAQNQKSDVTLFLSVDAHSEFKSSLASVKTNQYGGCDVTDVISSVVIVLLIYRQYFEEIVLVLTLIFLLSLSDMWMEESLTICLSMSWKIPSPCPRSLEKATSVPETPQQTCMSCASPTPASSSLSQTSTGSPGHFFLQIQW